MFLMILKLQVMVVVYIWMLLVFSDMNLVVLCQVVILLMLEIGKLCVVGLWVILVIMFMVIGLIVGL